MQPASGALTRMSLYPLLPVLLALLVLAGCASAPPTGSGSGVRTGQGDGLPPVGSGRGGYYKDDGPGDNPPPDLHQIPDAQPRVEPYSKAASRPYVIFGTTYTPITDDLPFTERGVGSWYGKKFHGLPTASGEIYDMYKMTAAHPTLPIPSYARLTSLDSGKQVIVRINDRGPFHASRIVDVSYVAALKLGLLINGSHDIKLERLLPADIERMASQMTLPAAALPATVLAPTVLVLPPVVPLTPVSPVPAGLAEMMLAETAVPQVAGGYYLQLGAFSHAGNAQQMRARLAPYAGTLGAIVVVHADALHRLYGGPFHSRAAAEQAMAALPVGFRLKPLVVQR
jgi:rare lipoprotein A